MQSSELFTTSGGSARYGYCDELRYRFSDNNLPRGLILDDGCGFGVGTALIAREDRFIIGLDPDKNAIKWAQLHRNRSNLNFQLKLSHSLPFDGSHFDGVLSLEVIEHLVDQENYLSEIARVLKPNGIFVLSTPNKAAVSSVNFSIP